MSTFTKSGPAVKTTRKPRAKKTRVIRVLTPHPRGQENMVEIVESGPRSEKKTLYWVSVIPSDFGFATRWSKFLANGGDIYECNIGGTGGIIEESEDGEQIRDEGPACCCCKGFEKHGHCKHVEATRALLKAGKL